MSYIKVTEAGTKAVKSFMETLDMEYNKDNEEKVINDILGAYTYRSFKFRTIKNPLKRDQSTERKIAKIEKKLVENYEEEMLNNPNMDWDFILISLTKRLIKENAK